MDSDLQAALRRALSSEPLAGKRVIDFECGSGELGVWMATEGAEVYLVDFHRATVDAALTEARKAGVERRVRGILVEGGQLDMFADHGFDLAFLRRIPAASLLAELARAMKPHARLVLQAASMRAVDEIAPAFVAPRLEWPPEQGWFSRLASRRKQPDGALISARRSA